MINYYMIYFETIGLLLMTLLVIKFTRISRKLSVLYSVVERPLIYVGILLMSMCFIFTMLAFAAMQIWGPYVSQFRRLRSSFYTMFTMFTLHSNQILPDISVLYVWNEWWAFFFMMLYIFFLQYMFMNLFTGIFFEEHRFAMMHEDTFVGKNSKHRLLNHDRVLLSWLSGLFACFRRGPRGGAAAAPPKEDNAGMDLLQQKMKEAKEKR